MAPPFFFVVGSGKSMGRTRRTGPTCPTKVGAWLRGANVRQKT